MASFRDKLERLDPRGNTRAIEAEPGPVVCQGVEEAVAAPDAQGAHEDGEVAQTTAHERAPKDAKLEALRQAIRSLEGRRERRAQRDLPDRAPDVPLPGAFEELPTGGVHRVTRVLEPHHAHGRVPVAHVLGVAPEILACLALDPGLGGVEPRGLLLLDLETTGLAGGTGTLPFLIGLGAFEDESLALEQLFLRRPGEEAPMLRRLAERLREASFVVTFNGKTFDWPLLRTRFVMNRLAVPPLPPHLDLLHVARRVWKRRLGATRLQVLEREVLGYEREGDVPGAEIPAEYLGYLRSGQPGRLAGVIAHNQDDLVAMVAILVRLAGLFERDAPDHAHGEDLLGLAETSLRAADAGRASSFAWASAEAGGDAAVAVAALLLAAKLARRREDVDEESRALVQALSAAGTEDELRARVHLELAKHHEHRRKDPAAALAHARELSRLALDDDLREAAERRVARLEARAMRAEQARDADRGHA